MPKVIYTLPLVGTLDNMVFEALHSGDESPRHLSPELTDEQVAIFDAENPYWAEYFSDRK